MNSKKQKRKKALAAMRQKRHRLRLKTTMKAVEMHGHVVKDGFIHGKTRFILEKLDPQPHPGVVSPPSFVQEDKTNFFDKLFTEILEDPRQSIRELVVPFLRASPDLPTIWWMAYNAGRTKAAEFWDRTEPKRRQANWDRGLPKQR